MNDKNVSISIVTTCKGRLHYLKQTLPSWLKLDYDNYDIIIVDYDDPDGTEEYILKNKEKLLKNSKCKDIKVVKVENKPYFNLSDARNRGIKVSDSELIFTIDSDVEIKNKKLLEKINNKYRTENKILFSNHFFLPTYYYEVKLFLKHFLGIKKTSFPLIVYVGTKNVDLGGTACFIRKYFYECGQFNPEINMKGHGYDDIEFFIRYLNYIFYKHFYPQTETQIVHNMNRFMNLIKVFPKSCFKVFENTLTEKSKFYPTEKDKSGEYNKRFLRELVEAPYEKIKDLNKFHEINLLSDVILLNSLKPKSQKQPFLNLLVSLASLLVKRGLFEEGKQKLLFLLKNFKLTKSEKIKILKHLFNIEKLRKKEFTYGEQLVSILLNKKKKALQDKILIVDTLFFLHRYEECFYWTVKLVKSAKHFHISEIFRFCNIQYLMCKKLEKRGCEQYIIHCMKVLNKEKKQCIAFPIYSMFLYKVMKKEKEVKQMQYLVTKNNNDDVPLFERAILDIINIIDLYDYIEKKKHSSLYLIPISLLEVIKNKNPVNTYRLASLYKKVNRKIRAKRMFLTLLEDKNTPPHLISGIYFHLGEIELKMNKINKASYYFSESLKANPFHKKAEEYLRLIKSNKYKMKI